MENPGMLQETAGLGLRSFQRFRVSLRIRKVGKRELPGKKIDAEGKAKRGKIGNLFIPSKILPLEWGVEAKGHGNSWNSWNSWNSGMVWLGRTLRIVPSQSLPIPTFPGAEIPPLLQAGLGQFQGWSGHNSNPFFPQKSQNPTKPSLNPEFFSLKSSRDFFPRISRQEIGI